MSPQRRRKKHLNYKRNKRIREMAECKVMMSPSSFFSLGDCQVKATPKKCAAQAVAPIRNDNMYVSQDVTVNEKTTVDRTLTYFLTRLDQVYGTKYNELREKFGFEWKSPRTARAIVAAIKAGEFSFENNEEDDDQECYSPWEYIRWTKAKEDLKGLTAAKETLDGLHTAAKDALWAEKDTSKYIEILEKFEKAKIH